MGVKLNIDEKYVVNEYLNGKSSLQISKEMGVSKPTILTILNKHNIVRKRDRCDSLNIEKRGDHFYINRICPICNKTIETKSKDRVIACRNHFNKINESRDCKTCSLEKQIGKGNPFYGKKHNKKTKNQISKSRKGKGVGENNSMANLEVRKKLAKTLRKKWDNGEMEFLREIFSKTMKETRRLGKIKSVIRSKKEKEIIEEIKNLGYEVKHSHRIDTKICDVFIPKLNLIIEYNGDYWHCNPNKYNSDYYHQVKKKTAKELWEYDKNKIDLILKNGYNLEVVWESDLKSNPDLIKKIITSYDRRE
jgi:G:T-mismatch repair DNA endonuclease (very short patch repair protein)